MQKSVKLSVLDKCYSVTTDEAVDDVYNAAQLVSTLMKNKKEKMTSASDEKIAVVVALELAAIITKNSKVMHEYDDRISSMLDLLAKQGV